MRLPPRFISTTWLLAIPSFGTALDIDCSHVRVDGQSFDLSALNGPHSVHVIKETPPSLSNTTYTIDICKPLRKTKDIPAENQCPAGTRVCGIEYDYNLADGTNITKEVRPIAGNFIHENRPLDPKWSRTKTPKSDSDAPAGLRLELNGGKFPFKGSQGQQQKAVVVFVCDKARTGLEGDEPDDRPKEDGDGGEDGDNVIKSTVSSSAKDDEDDDEKQRKSLEFVSYKTEGEDEIGVLRLRWRTKYACEGGTEHDPGSKKSSHWGFFTWFIIIIFLTIATYLIFGSWLNYNRYGARGWDLLPHGDTIRDIPYLLKDWARRVVYTVQGGGSRGGYSAV